MSQLISPKDLKKRLDNGESIQVIDVREDWELATASVDFATHIPMNDVPDRLDEIARDVPVVIMCHLGGRSAQVANFLAMQGYTNVLDLEGGIVKWAVDVDPSLPQR